MYKQEFMSLWPKESVVKSFGKTFSDTFSNPADVVFERTMYIYGEIGVTCNSDA